MITSLEKILEENNITRQETVYAESCPEIFEFQIVSGDFYSIKENMRNEKELIFKNSVNISDFAEIQKEVPTLAMMDFPGRDKMPFFTNGLERIREAQKEGRSIAVEGGPCLFGVSEVEVEIFMKNGEHRIFDYCTGKRHGMMANSDSEDMEVFFERHGDQIENVIFHDHKKGITSQEYESILYVFQAAEALHGTAVIPLPDMSYSKYLSAVIGNLDDVLRKKIMDDFHKVSWRISDLYIDLIHQMEKTYPEVSCVIVHERNQEICNKFYTGRQSYIERNKILRLITSMPNRKESVKDYISMPALPYYLLGIKDILEIDSVDETDSYRKCAKAHKGVINLNCILYPERLSTDGKNTIYQTDQDYKEYL